MVVTPGNVIGFPVGIWALVVLARSEVRQAFGKTEHTAATAQRGASA
jgi:hypothetical protein